MIVKIIIIQKSLIIIDLKHDINNIVHVTRSFPRKFLKKYINLVHIIQKKF